MSKSIKLIELKQHFLGKTDVFICCASYESRCLSIAMSIDKESTKKAIIFFNDEYSQESEKYNTQLNELFNNKNSVKLSTSNSLISADNALDSLESVCTKYNNPSILIDITTFTRESLLIILRVICSYKDKLGEITFAYTPAKTMNGDWLSKGIFYHRSILGYMGDFLPNRPLHMILMIGFEINRAKGIIDEYEPDYITIGLGDKNESIKPEFHEKNKKFVEELVSYFDNNVNTFSFSLRNPYATMKTLDENVKLYQNTNTIIVPLNNKISTIGAGLYGITNQDVQLCYTEVEEYNTANYSEPDDYCYIIKLES